MLIYLQSIVAIFIGIVSAITDFKDKKIYNKYVIASVFISLVIYIILRKQIEIIYIKNYIINFLISIAISFGFFYILGNIYFLNIMETKRKKKNRHHKQASRDA